MWSLSFCDVMTVSVFESKNVSSFLLSATPLQERNVRKPLARAEVL